MTTINYILIGGAVILVLIAYLIGNWYEKRHNKPAALEVGVPLQPEYEEVYARVYDSVTRKMYNDTLTPEIVKQIMDTWHSLGRQWNKDGKWLYAINRYIGVDNIIRYRPVEAVMSPTRDNPPSKVHRALNHPEIAVYFNVTPKKNMLQQLVPVLIFVGGLLFLYFMWTAQMKGN